MEHSVPGVPGTMVALLDPRGIDHVALQALLNEEYKEHAYNVSIAASNTPRQVVVSGPTPGVEAVVAAARACGVARKAMPLAVAAAFHSDMMSDAAERFNHVLEYVVIHPPRIPVMSAVVARPMRDVGDIRARLVQQVRSGVQWDRTWLAAREMGVRSCVEVGPGNVLTAFMRDLNPASASIVCTHIDTAEHVYAFASNTEL
jgi:[acyl-carrier-protein] S-malonyltransferase